MATKWISPTWRMPEESNQSKFDNYSLDFDGTNDFITCGNISELNGTTEATWYGWFNRSSSGSYYIMSTWDTSAANGQFTPIQSPTALTVYMSSSAGAQKTMFQNTSLTFNTGTWYHLAFVYNESEASDSDKLKVYINSVIQTNTAAGAALTSLNSSTASFEIGKIGGYTSSKFTGDIGQVGVYDTALTSPQITALYNSGTPVNPMALKPLPVAYYPLGGSSTGSASTLTIPNESVPSATVFDFVSADGDRILCSPTATPGTGPINSINGTITVGIWINSTQSSVNAYPMNRDYLGGPNSDWRFRQRSDTNLIQLYLFNTSSSTLSVELTGSNDPQGNPYIVINDGNWHHIVMVYNGTDTAELYTDGVLQGSTTSSGFGTLKASARTVIGGVNNSGNPYAGGGAWNGKLSNAQIWDTNLSSSEVTTLYNNGVPYTGTQPQAANLKGWWKMNVDTSTWNGSDWIIGEAQANYSSALNFVSGDSDYVDLSNNSSLYPGTGDVSYSAWIKPSSTTGFKAIFGVQNLNTGAKGVNVQVYNGEIWVFVGVGVGGQWGVNTGGSTGGGGFISSGANLTLNNWHHIAFTFNRDGNGVIYINGEPNRTAAANPNDYSSVDITSTANVFLGRGDGYFDGEISNAAIFNTSLDAAAISTLFNSGTPQTSISSSPISWWKLNNTTTGIQDSVGSNNGTITGGVTQVNSFVSTLNGISSGMTTANLVNSDLTRSIPYSSYSMVFDSATDDYINVGTDSSLNVFDGDFSISIWFNHTNAAGSADAFLEFGAFTNKAAMTLGFTSNTGVGFAFGNPSVIPWYYNAGSGFNDGNWHNMVATRTGTTYKIFVDGVDLSYSTGTFNSAGVNRIGTTDYNTFYNGKLSNVAVFGSTLTEDQVLTIYNGGVPNDISSLSPVSWWSLAGDSYFNGNDWICPDLGSASNNGTSGNMGGEELVGDGPGSTANGTATSMDIPANLKGNAPNSSKNAFSVNMNSADRVEDVPA